MILRYTQAALLIFFCCFLYSCASYNKSMTGYYERVKAGEYDKALQSLQHNKLIKKDRNALLYNLEAGRLYRLQNDFVNSNRYLNRADGMMENNSTNVKDVALGNLLNPMHESYKAEDHEQFMVHFYKALNYAMLGQTEDAVVEARRITLSNDKQQQKFNGNSGRYINDAFGLNVQGMIYEMAGDMNNAFISYRNAADVYLKSGSSYYGVSFPSQLKKDLLRTATAMGFQNELKYYEASFSGAAPDTQSAFGELILFVEEGNAPVKQQHDFMLTSGKSGIGNFIYTDQNGVNNDFNFDYASYGISSEKLTDVRALRIALPAYEVQYPAPQNISVSSGANVYPVQLAQDLNTVATSILKERFVKEMATALARQLTKKIVEKGAEAATESIAKEKNKDDKKDTTDGEKEKQKKKRQEKAEHAGEVAGFLMNVVNTATEKADTRNWQSLPAFVSYVRIPLHEGENAVTVKYGNNEQVIKINANRGIQMRSIVL